MLRISTRMMSTKLRRGVTPRIQTSISALDQVDAEMTEAGVSSKGLANAVHPPILLLQFY